MKSPISQYLSSQSTRKNTYRCYCQSRSNVKRMLPSAWQTSFPNLKRTALNSLSNSMNNVLHFLTYITSSLIDVFQSNLSYKVENIRHTKMSYPSHPTSHVLLSYLDKGCWSLDRYTNLVIELTNQRCCLTTMIHLLLPLEPIQMKTDKVIGDLFFVCHQLANEYELFLYSVNVPLSQNTWYSTRFLVESSNKPRKKGVLNSYRNSTHYPHSTQPQRCRQMRYCTLNLARKKWNPPSSDQGQRWPWRRNCLTNTTSRWCLVVTKQHSSQQEK